MSAPTPPPRPDTPWIETRAGGLFFVNVLLVTPAAVALLPLVLGGLLRAAGILEGPSRVFDTIPAMADYFVPRLGWLAAPAAWVAWKGLRLVDRPGPRAALFVFLAVHLATVLYTLIRWFA